MRRSITTIQIKEPKTFKKQLFTWAAAHKMAIWLDSNAHQDLHSSFDVLLAVGVASELCCKATRNAFQKLSTYQQNTRDWIFGHLTYDLKNDLEDLNTLHADELQFPALYFFQPKKIITLRGNELRQLYVSELSNEAKKDQKAIQNRRISHEKPNNKLQIKSRISKAEYLNQVHKMQDYIHHGDIYEANFCQEFYARGRMEPILSFNELNRISEAPFATYLKYGQKYLLCTSPERYIKKDGTKLISQPIKGTARRSENAKEDAKIALKLIKNEKERSENIMITDLVRNDLSRIAQKGSVKVEELCGLHSFKQVHQLISTISAHASPGLNPVEILKKTFPMGSMTGAPKLSAMKIIEQLENYNRGLYSGSVGYFTPEGDFDFNVVIRSILYDALREYVSFSVGSAITSLSNPEQEYEECLLKARAMREVLE